MIYIIMCLVYLFFFIITKQIAYNKQIMQHNYDVIVVELKPDPDVNMITYDTSTVTTLQHFMIYKLQK
jgi:hypothetical protein